MAGGYHTHLLMSSTISRSRTITITEDVRFSGPDSRRKIPLMAQASDDCEGLGIGDGFFFNSVSGSLSTNIR